MREEKEEKARNLPTRLFFGAQVTAPWPQPLPSGRWIAEEVRHITLAFLGEVEIEKLQGLLSCAPLPSWAIAPVGCLDALLFLPPDLSRVVASHVRFLSHSTAVESYQQELTAWLHAQGYSLDGRPFFPHVTLARRPFNRGEWLSEFSPLPFFIQGIHLYKSEGNLRYTSIWEFPLVAPFEEFEHTADIAFRIRGSTIPQIHLHAQVALAFHFPKLVEFFTPLLQHSLEEVIIALNESIALADATYGAPFKGISFHGTLLEDPFLTWEMIVDV